MLNFTVGPVMSFEDTLRISSENSPYFRTQDFSDVVLGCESRIAVRFFDCLRNRCYGGNCYGCSQAARTRCRC